MDVVSTLHELLPGEADGSGLLPSQYQAPNRRSWLGEAERALLSAVLQDAIRCYLKCTRDRRTRRAHALYSEVDAWIFSPSRQGLFAFVNLCEALGLNPSFVRQGLKECRRPYLRRAASYFGRASAQRPELQRTK